MKGVDGVNEPWMPHSVSRSPKKIGWSITPRIGAHSLSSPKSLDLNPTLPWLGDLEQVTLVGVLLTA